MMELSFNSCRNNNSNKKNTLESFRNGYTPRLKRVFCACASLTEEVVRKHIDSTMVNVAYQAVDF